MDLDYTLAICYVCIAAEWLVLLEADYKDAYIYSPVQNSSIFETFKNISLLLLIISLIIRMFKDNFLAILGYIAVFFVVWFINGATLYRIYRAIFGRYLIGSIIPMILLVPALVYLMRVW